MEVSAGSGSARVAGRFNPGNEVKRMLIVEGAILRDNLIECRRLNRLSFRVLRNCLEARLVHVMVAVSQKRLEHCTRRSARLMWASCIPATARLIC